MNKKSKEKKIKNLVGEEEFKKRTSIGKYIRLLKMMYEDNEEDFEKVTEIEGSKRKFVFKSHEPKESRMKSRPRGIEETPYSVITRINNQTKKKVLMEAMDILGYNEDVASIVVDQID